LVWLGQVGLVGLGQVGLSLLLRLGEVRFLDLKFLVLVPQPWVWFGLVGSGLVWLSNIRLVGLGQVGLSWSVR
jgi:hypothetical protein